MFNASPEGHHTDKLRGIYIIDLATGQVRHLPALPELHQTRSSRLLGDVLVTEHAYDQTSARVREQTLTPRIIQRVSDRRVQAIRKSTQPLDEKAYPTTEVHIVPHSH